MDDRKKIENILKAIKLDVDDISAFEKELDSILGMFQEIRDVDTSRTSATLNRKRISLTDLREDLPKYWNFRPEMRGKYFRVPNVSKK